VLACLDIIESEPEIIEQLWDNAQYMRDHLKALGYDTGRSNTPIIPILIRDDIRTVLAWRALVDNGVYTNPVVPPGVPANMSLLRTSYTATHRQEHLDKALAVLADVGRKLDLIPGEGSLYKAPATTSENVNVG
jgi:7-keto-8-aminopelargonate synthetase-like enzyme